MFGSSSLQDSEYPRLPGVLAKFEYELSEEEEEVNYQVEKLVSYQIEKIVVKETLVSNKVEKLASMQANNTPSFWRGGWEFKGRLLAGAPEGRGRKLVAAALKVNQEKSKTSLVNFVSKICLNIKQKMCIGPNTLNKHLF